MTDTRKHDFITLADRLRLDREELAALVGRPATTVKAWRSPSHPAAPPQLVVDLLRQELIERLRADIRAAGFDLLRTEVRAAGYEIIPRRAA
jgi:outer membrane protein TolC